MKKFNDNSVKDVVQIYSYRMGVDLTHPYDKFNSMLLENGNFLCKQSKVTNYGPNNGCKDRQLFVMTSKQFTPNKHMERVKNACSER